MHCTKLVKKVLVYSNCVDLERKKNVKSFVCLPPSPRQLALQRLPKPKTVQNSVITVRAIINNLSWYLDSGLPKLYTIIGYYKSYPLN